mmetsp:Transcript_1752/g.5325  ORF Transcript_1752/g.5325 Transcript_1752/m.5325 type:complete len:212 (+) Transcript_1752:445-1080(+)
MSCLTNTYASKEGMDPSLKDAKMVISPPFGLFEEKPVANNCCCCCCALILLFSPPIASFVALLLSPLFLPSFFRCSVNLMHSSKSCSVCKMHMSSSSSMYFNFDESGKTINFRIRSRSIETDHLCNKRKRMVSLPTLNFTINCGTSSTLPTLNFTINCGTSSTLPPSLSKTAIMSASASSNVSFAPINKSSPKPPKVLSNIPAKAVVPCTE